MATKLPNTATAEEARRWLERYPYFTLPAILALKGGAAPGPETDALAARVAISLPDMDALAQTLGQQAPVFDNFYPDEQKPTPGTIDTIDTFLATFGKADDRETDALSKLIFSPVPDYAAVLAAEERDSVPTDSELNDPTLSEQDRLINSFIADSKRGEGPAISPAPDAPQAEEPESDKLTNEAPKVQTKPAAAPKVPENASLTESLVRVLIKNHNYSKAIEIISDLSLKNPEKSIYFADQIRFLRKLIINENKK